MKTYEQPSEHPQSKGKIISSIWGVSVGMLAICIALSPATDSGPIIPMLVVAGAALSTCVIWLTGNKQESEEIAELKQTLNQLHHRIASLEIASSDEELKRSIERLSREQSTGKM